jgi:hypothetical protein
VRRSNSPFNPASASISAGRLLLSIRIKDILDHCCPRQDSRGCPGSKNRRVVGRD